jgi:hypothetical protein
MGNKGAKKAGDSHPSLNASFVVDENHNGIETHFLFPVPLRGGKLTSLPIIHHLRGASWIFQLPALAQHGNDT